MSADASSRISLLLSRLNSPPGLPVHSPTPSYWQTPPHPLSSHQSPNLPSQTTIAIIGSGITGGSISHHLLRQRPELDATLLEARSLTSGATGRNGGHIKENPMFDYDELKVNFGKEIAKRIVKFRMAHLDALVARGAELDDSLPADRKCLARAVDGVDAFFNAGKWEDCKERRVGFMEDLPEEQERWKLYEAEEARERYGLSANVLGCSSGPSGAIWPYRFVTASIASDMSSYPSFKVETHTEVTSITVSESNSAYPYQIHTNRGVISATIVVHATNAHVAHLLPALQGKVLPVRGQMTVQSRPANFPTEGAIRSYLLHYTRGYDYMTQSPSTPGEIYLGGGLMRGQGIEVEEDIGSVCDDEQSQKALEALRHVIPDYFANGKGAEVTHAWTGVMGFTSDNLPLAGRVPASINGRNVSNKESSEWVAAGFNGHGMAYCWLTGKALAEMILEGEGAAVDWFPKDQFACNNERVAALSAERAVEVFSHI